MDFKFDNIAISGGVAVGTTTLLDNLKPYLEPYGWKFSSTGNFVREYTKENILPLATLVSEEFDKEIEKKVYEKFLNEDRWVIEGWLAGFVARKLNNTLRVFLYCSEESIRVDRLANRDRLSVGEAKQFVKLREEKNIKKWKKIYGDYNFFDKKYYHLSIDTYSSGQHETVGKVLDCLGYDGDKIQISKK